MTTVVDPTGTPTIVFNRSGTVMIPLVSARSTDPLTIIDHYAQTTVVLADKPSPNTAVTGFKIGSGFETGDTLILCSYPEPSWTYEIWDENNNLLITGAEVTFIKLPDGSWRKL